MYCSWGEEVVVEVVVIIGDNHSRACGVNLIDVAQFLTGPYGNGGRGRGAGCLHNPPRSLH